VVVRTGEAIVLDGHFDVYRTDVGFIIELQLRADDDDLMEVP
jgi:hypothetical protein